MRFDFIKIRIFFKRIPLILFLIVLIPLAALSAALHADTNQPVSGILYTKDKIAIFYDQYKRGSDSVIIVCPGFFNSKDNRWMRSTVELLSSTYDVIIFDFRGHGKSGGKYTWSAKEDMDVDAVVSYAANQGYRHIGIVAFSLGAAAAINTAATRSDIESMVLISCPSRFSAIDFHFWEPGMWADLKDNIDCKWEGKGAKTGSIFMAKKAPIDIIGKINKTAIFFIEGDSDWIIKKHHSEELYNAAGTYKKLEIIKGGFHAERLLEFHYEKIKELILSWFSETLK